VLARRAALRRERGTLATEPAEREEFARSRRWPFATEWIV